MTIESVLQKYYGFSHLRAGQRQVIESVLAGQPTLALLPTGGGKSLCFQLPGLMLGGTTIVVSPLIALMADQVHQLNSRGLRATALTSTLRPAELNRRLDQVRRGELRFVYLSPERLLHPAVLQACRSLTIPLVAIDEAHCLSQWGHDFRPQYRLIRQFIDQLARPPTVLAVTATATPRVQQDIITTLGLGQPTVVATSFQRTNLFLAVPRCDAHWQKSWWLRYFLQDPAHRPAIIYTTTRVAAESLAQWLSHLLPLEPCVLYHGGMATADRQQSYEAFISGRANLIVATSAFGMGVDKANVRLVIHVQLSTLLEEYYQQAGRAGRDGLPATCVLLTHPADRSTTTSLLSAQPAAQAAWRAMLGYTTTRTCRHRYILEYFGERPTTQPHCAGCDSCQSQWLTASETDRQLYRQLAELAKNRSPPHGWPASILAWLVLLKPQTPAEAGLIPGVNQIWLDRYWAATWEVISAYK